MTVPRLIREPLLALLRRLGYEVVKLNREGALYGPILPGASYSPWNVDAEFQRLFQALQGRTLVDVYRCHELWTLVDMVKHCEGDLLEVGVWRGGTGALMARRAALLGLEATVHLCDTFEGVVKASPNDPVYVGGEHADTSEAQVRELLDSLSLRNARVHKGVFPEDTGSALQDRRFRLCHIDVDVYDSARDILHWVWGRLSVGGVVVYDDYGTASTAGVTRLVNEQQGLPDRVTLYNLNGHAVTVKTR